MRALSLMLILSVSLAYSQTKKPSGVRSAFASAQKLYQAGKYNQALAALTKIIKKYPTHQPTMIYIAKSLYRTNRLPEAQQYFSQINPKSLDTATSYEYGLSHFWTQKYPQALTGFKRVPKGHSLADLANYYGGISALKMKKLNDAEAMMERAVVLPSKLAKSRKLYLKHIAELKLMKQKKEMAKDKKKNRKKDKAKKKEAEPTPAPTPDPDAKYSHKGYEEVLTEARLGILYKQQLVDKHGFAEEETDIRIAYFEFKGGPILPLPVKFNEDQAAIGLEISLKAEEQEVDGIERRNVESDDVDDIQRIQTTDPAKKRSQFGSFNVNPWIEFPSPMQVWIGVGGEFQQKYRDFERDKIIGMRSGYLGIGTAKFRGNDLTVKYTYSEVTQDKDVQTAINNFDIFYWVPKLYNDIGGYANFVHDFYVYHQESLDGPSSATSLELDIHHNFPFGTRVGLRGSGQYQSEYILHDLPTFGEVTADGQAYTGRIYLRLRPIKWFSADIYQEVQKSVWQVTPSDAEETFQQNQPDYIQTFFAKASLNLIF